MLTKQQLTTFFCGERGTNLVETEKVMNEIDMKIRDIPQMEAYSRTTGWASMFGQGSSTGNFIRGMIPGYGTSNGFELYLQDQKGGKIEDLEKIAGDFINELNKRPEITRAKTSFDSRFPMYLVEVDAVQCKRNGISPNQILSVLSGYVGSSYASNMNRFSKLYRVMLQAAPEYRLDTDALKNMFVRNNKGEMSPINQYLKLTRIYGPQSISRFNLFTAIQINGNATDGYSSGQAIQAVREVAQQVLPEVSSLQECSDLRIISTCRSVF